MNLADIDVLDLLPQRPPFVMIDRLVGYDESATETSLTIRPDNIFVDAATGIFSPEGLIENIAQTCAARLGYYYKYILRQDVRVGVIGALRHCKFGNPVIIGNELSTEIKVREEIFGMTLIDGIVKVGNEVVASAEMKIALAPDQS